jgi:ABC-type transporter Mla subunit MlaD
VPQSLTYIAWAQLEGVVPVVTPIDGHDELVSDGETGLVVAFDDVPGTARVLDTLAQDRELLVRLSRAAREAAAAYPTPADEAAALRAAMDEAPPASDRPERLLMNARAVMEPIAQERRALDRTLREYEERIESLTSENDSLKAELEEARRSVLARIRRRY